MEQSWAKHNIPTIVLQTKGALDGYEAGIETLVLSKEAKVFAGPDLEEHGSRPTVTCNKLRILNLVHVVGTR